MPTPAEALASAMDACRQQHQPKTMGFLVASLRAFEDTHPLESHSLTAKAEASATLGAESGGPCEDQWQADIVKCGEDHPNDPGAYEACVREAYRKYDNC